MPATSIAQWGVVVRPARADEYEDVVLFATRSHDLSSPDRRDVLFIAVDGPLSQAHGIGGTARPTIIGYGSLHRHRDVLWIGVHPAHRRRGVATKILEAVLEHNAAVGIEVPAANLAAVAFAAGRGRLVDYRRRSDLTMWLAFHADRRPDVPPSASMTATCSCAEHRARRPEGRPGASRNATRRTSSGGT